MSSIGYLESVRTNLKEINMVCSKFFDCLKKKPRDLQSIIISLNILQNEIYKVIYKKFYDREICELQVSLNSKLDQIQRLESYILNKLLDKI